MSHKAFVPEPDYCLSAGLDAPKHTERPSALSLLKDINDIITEVEKQKERKESELEKLYKGRQEIQGALYHD